MIKKAISIVLTVIIMASVMSLMGCHKRGEMCMVWEAYERGWLTEEDLMNIHYLRYGYLEKNGEKVDYTPTVGYNEISEEVQYDMRKAWQRYFSSPEYTPSLNVAFMPYGYYHGCYAVQEILGIYIASAFSHEVAGIVFSGVPAIMIFRY